jgi:hypothetical protein
MKHPPSMNFHGLTGVLQEFGDMHDSTKGFTFSSKNFRMVALFFVSVYMSGRILEVQQQVCSFTVSGWW